MYAALGSLVTLPCVFSPDLAPVDTVWSKIEPGSVFDPSPLPSDSYYPLTPEHSSDKSIVLKQVAFMDEGKYRCNAAVEGGWMKRNMQLVVAKGKFLWIQFRVKNPLNMNLVFASCN